MIQVGDGGNQDVRWLNDVFDFSLVGRGSASSTSLNLTAPMPLVRHLKGASALANINVTSMIGKGSTPGFTPIYGNNDQSSVALIEYGEGNVVYLGEDYFSFGYATDWGEGRHVKGSYTDNSSYNAWVKEIVPRALLLADAEKPEDPEEPKKPEDPETITIKFDDRDLGLEMNPIGVITKA